MLFDPPDVQLAKFTQKNGKRKTIATIRLGELESWKKLTQKTAGRYMAKYMAPSLWDNSIESLQTALAIVVAYTPSSLYASDEYQRVLVALRKQILKASKAKYEAAHGNLKPKALLNSGKNGS
jgi:hypothetical protein